MPNQGDKQVQPESFIPRLTLFTMEKCERVVSFHKVNYLCEGFEEYPLNQQLGTLYKRVSFEIAIFIFCYEQFFEILT